MIFEVENDNGNSDKRFWTQKEFFLQQKNPNKTNLTSTQAEAHANNIKKHIKV